MKKVIISVIISIFVVFIIDISLYTFDINNLNKLFKKFNAPQYKWSYSIFAKHQYLNGVLNSDFRKPIHIKSKKSPIVIFGCSYAYGAHLESDENFGANLAKLTNRPVYNFGISGYSVQHFLALLENKDFSDIKNPEYVIYVYMYDHMRRMYSKFYNNCDKNSYFRYLYKNNDLVIDENKSPSLYIFRKLHCFLINFITRNPQYKQENMKIFSKYIEKANIIIKEKFPNSKFIIYVYEDDMNYDWELIEKMGIKIIKNPDLDKVRSMKLLDGHPSAEAWKYFTPIFIKEAGIN